MSILSLMLTSESMLVCISSKFHFPTSDAEIFTCYKFKLLLDIQLGYRDGGYRV